MGIRESSYGYWSSSRSFLWVAAGAAIGIGNVARLPYLAGEYGGSVFLAAYALALALVSWPLLVTEWMTGRWTREDLITGLGHLADAAGALRAWSVIGRLSLIAAVLVLSYYSVIAGWSLAYIFRAASGALAGLDAPGAQAVFYNLARDPERSLAWHTIFMVTACVIVAHGVRDGIERAANYLVPAALVLILSVFAYAYTEGDGKAAVLHVLTPDWSRFGWRGALEAVHQAFFTMALGLGAMFAFGGYLPANAPLGPLAVGVILLDTVFSLVAGCALYSMVFAAGLDPAPGLTLLFQVFPRALPPGLAATMSATAVYLVLFLITLAAAVALMEPSVRYLMERLRTTRVFAATSSAVMIWFLGLASLLSFNVMENLRFFDRNFFDWIQLVTGRVLLPLTGLLLAIFMSRGLPADILDDIWGQHAPWLRGTWQWLLRYPARIVLIALLLYGLGLLDLMVELFSTDAR